MNKFYCIFVLLLCLTTQKGCLVASGKGGGEPVVGNRYATDGQIPQQHAAHHQHQHQQQQLHKSHYNAAPSPKVPSPQHQQHANMHLHAPAGSGGHVDVGRNTYNLLSEAMSQAVTNEFSSVGSGSADGSCHADDIDCGGQVQDHLGMEAIATLHRQLDDDDNGNIDLSESDDFLREELKYDSGYEKRQKAFHFNDDMHISVKELWEAWLRSEVHNWTMEQTTDWLSQSVQLPQYVDLFKIHKVTGAALPRLAVNNMHYVSNVLGIKDPIHKQKIMLKAMDVVLFGPPRETGTRWKDYILVTLLLSAIIGCWYAYQQNKHAKRHLRRMAQDMEGLQRAEQSLQEMQKELERARMEQENVATEKMDLERRLKEAPSLSSSSSDLEVQQLKKEIEILRSELSRAEIELVDNCWSPPPQLQSWLQYTYELENKNHLKKRISAEKQLQLARESCEKLRKKRSSLVGAFVSTHGKSIDDVDRSIVEARNSLGEVTNELQERLHRWKQIESCLGLNIVNNNGFPYLESVLYGRNGGSSLKGSRARMTNSTDDLDDDSVQGMLDNYNRAGLGSGIIANSSNTLREDSSGSDDGVDGQSVQFYLGTTPSPAILNSALLPLQQHQQQQQQLHRAVPPTLLPVASMDAISNHNHLDNNNLVTATQLGTYQLSTPPPIPPHNSAYINMIASNDSQNIRTAAEEVATLGLYTPLSKQQQPQQQLQQPQHILATKQSTGAGASLLINDRANNKQMVKQHSTASQLSTSSTSSSVHSAPLPSSNSEMYSKKTQSPGRWSSHEGIQQQEQHGKLNEPTPFNVASTTPSKTSAAPSHGDTQLENIPHLSKGTGTGSCGDSGSLKKRKHRLRFPGFGRSKKSSNSSSTGSLNISEASYDKNKHI